MIALVVAASIVPAAPATAPGERARFVPSAVVASAQVMVRIVSGASVRLGQPAGEPGARLRWASVEVDGQQRQAQLIEFP